MSDADLSAKVRAALRLRHPASSARGAARGALLEEVRNATGFAATRSADALAFSFWPSDGLTLIGYEIKASRADWIRELKDPEKSFAFARYCDFWWIAAGTTKVVDVEELPPGWGLLVLNAKDRLHPIVPARKLAPEPLTRDILMSIVRTACTSAWEPVVQAHIKEVSQRVRESAESDSRQVRRDLEALQARVREFEASAGVSLSGYEGPRQIGAAVRAVMGALSAGYGGAADTIGAHAKVLRRLAEQCEAALEEIQHMQQEAA